MNYLYKATALFFSFVQFFLGISAENNCLSLNSKIQNNKFETISSYFPIKNPNLYIINWQGSRFLTSFKSQLNPGIKNHTNAFYNYNLFPEIKKLCINSAYFSFSRTIFRNLTTIDVVFPFHCFW